MKIIIAIDSFKGSLSSIEAGEAVQNGFLQMHPEWETTLIPIADGGEGSVDCFLNAVGGALVYCDSVNPFFEKMQGFYIK